MSRVWTVAIRDLRSFFDHATAYILVVAFLGLAFFLSFRNLYAAGTADLRSFFGLLPWLLVVFVPAITMRSLAEERSQGTLQWVMAQPLDEAQLVAGKFLGHWLFVLAAVAGTLPMALGVTWIAGAALGPVTAQYVGAGLLAAHLTAVGLFTSALTRNQITAFILGAIVSVAFVLAGTPFTLMAVPPSVSGVVGRLAILPHFDGVARGVIDLRDVLYFVSMAALFGGLAWFWVVRERLSPGRGAYRRLRVGVAAGAAAVLVVNLLGQHIHGRIDLTADDLYTLSNGTRETLEDLDDLVTVKLFVSDALPPEVQTTLRDVRDLLADYRRLAGGQLRVEELQPDEDEEAAREARSLGIREMQFNVMREDEFEVRSGWLGLAVQYADQHEAIPFVSRTDDLEYRLTSAIVSMTADRTPRVVFLTGFGARSPFQLQELNQALSDRYEVSSRNLEPDSTGAVPSLSPDSVDLVVMVGPTGPVAPEAVDAVAAYLDRGGSGFFMLDNNRLNAQAPMAEPLRTGLEEMLAERGVRITGQMAYDMQSNQTVSLGGRSVFNLVQSYPLWPVAVPATDHVTTRDMEVVSLAWPAVLEVTDSARATPIWSTTRYGGAKPARGPIDPQTAVTRANVDPSTLGRRILAVSVTPPDDGAGGRLMVVGDADFIQSRFVQGSPQNLAFAANAVDWLAQDESLIEIRSKDRTPPPLVFGSELQKAALRWGNNVGVPLLFILLGLLRAAVRRKRSRELWHAVESHMSREETP